MSAPNSAARWHAPLAMVALAMLAAAGFAAGWFVPPAYSPTVDRLRTWLDPTCMGAICAGLIHHQVKQRRATVVATLLCCVSFVFAVLAVLRQ